MSSTEPPGDRRTCPICDSPDVGAPRDLGTNYRECGACGFLWAVGLVTLDDPNRAYTTNTVETGETEAVADLLEQEDKAGRQAYYDRHLARLHRHLTPPGKLVEVGCGAGGFSARARAAGWDVLAIEQSGRLSAEATRALGAEHVLTADFQNARVAAESIDAVVAIDLIEHVPDPHALVGRVVGWLRPGGVTLLQTPNAGSLRRRLHGARWNMLQPDRHHVFHTIRSLMTLLQSHGMEVLEIGAISGVGWGGPLRRAASFAYGQMLSLASLGNGLVVIGRKR